VAGLIHWFYLGFVTSAIFAGISAPALSQQEQDRSILDPIKELEARASATATSSALNGPVTTIRGLTGDVSVVLDGIELTAPNTLTRRYGNINQFDLNTGAHSGTSSANFEVITRTPGNTYMGSAHVTLADDNSYAIDTAINGPVIRNSLFYGLEAGLRTTDGFFRNTFLNSDAVDDDSDVHAGARLLFNAYDGASLDLKANWMRLRSGGGGYDGVFALPVFSTFLNQPTFDEDINTHTFSFHSNIRPKLREDTLELSANWTEAMPWATFKAWALYSDYDSDYASDGTAGMFDVFNADAFCLSSTADQASAGIALPPPQNLNSTPGGSIFGAFTSTGCDGTRFQVNNQEDISSGFQLAGSEKNALRWQFGGAYRHSKREAGVNTGIDTGVGVTRDLFVAAGNGNPTEQLYHDTFTTDALKSFGRIAYDVSSTLEGSATLKYQYVRQKTRSLVPTADRTTYLVHLPGADFTGDGALNPALSLFVNPTGVIADRRKSFSQFTPNIDIAWSGLPNTTLYARWSMDFRPGGFNHAGVAATASLFINSALGTNVGIADQFAKERSRTAESGFSITALNDRLTVSGAGYYTNVKNMQFTEFLVTPLGMVPAINSIDKARIFGGDISASISIMRTVTLFASGSLISTKIKSMAARPAAVENELPFAPDYKINGGALATYSLLANVDVNGRVEVTHVGPTSFHVLQCQSPPTQFGVPGNTCATSRDNYTTIDLLMGLEGNKWAVNAFARNVTNDSHLADAIVVPELGYSFARPDALRRFGMELSFRF
jgi:iron complex outermembrane recepter protein